MYTAAPFSASEQVLESCTDSELYELLQWNSQSSARAIKRIPLPIGIGSNFEGQSCGIAETVHTKQYGQVSNKLFIIFIPAEQRFNGTKLQMDRWARGPPWRQCSRHAAKFGTGGLHGYWGWLPAGCWPFRSCCQGRWLSKPGGGAEGKFCMRGKPLPMLDCRECWQQSL